MAPCPISMHKMQNGNGSETARHALCTAACLQVVFRRYAIFMVFLLVPHGLIKALAARSVEVEEGSGEDNEENGGDMEDNAGDDAARPGDEEEEGRGRGAKGGPSGAGGPAAKLNITALQALAAACGHAKHWPDIFLPPLAGFRRELGTAALPHQGKSSQPGQEGTAGYDVLEGAS
ncbi:hypothetical protein HaLaN_20211 [Haematococcus lacustris]|uniref:Uncharacterized protein n=1 Tax=Haematococcus lacustris TaxID=44745 RepID=A0A699ZVK0_HAELA|nr:hypothetical protein HaLaN_20211 [Haematococcus lacustris]